ncbi:Gfo/Idh/MocA family protein [Nocardia vermiculata]|uniref:Gfo/Idh/MocA family oxidoreductase n=1 Tax=Nocardia vermiculata TaxID=257274 RepID=A0A846Y4F7_9NOCA|nr:Gfo/Idh/MocA family oxidoreductase [Nocardia vermiculata]NKY52820.1 Gfo/Idh/MocA family oxidoreductase [Nocardia vermiculata]
MSQIGVAVVGYGLAGEVFHAPLIAADPALRVAAVVTSSAERGERARREHPGVRIFGSPDELFADPAGIGLVVIAAPNRSHASLALRAIAAGLPVVVDKPFAVTAGAAEEVIAAADKAGLPLSVFQNRRWDSDFRTVRKLVSDGSLGEVYRFESRFERWRPTPKGSWRELGTTDEGAGSLYDLGSHLVDQALTLFGPVVDVYCERDRRRAGVEADDDAFLALTHAGGVRSHLWMSAVAAQSGPRFRVLGSEAAYLTHGMDPQEQALRAGRRPGDREPWGTVESDHWGRLGTPGETRSIPTLPGDWPAFYRMMAAAVAGAGPVPVDPRDALETVRIVENATR